MELENTGNEDLLRASNESAIEFLGPFSNRKPRNSGKNSREKECISNSKKQKMKKQQLSSIIGAVTQEELYFMGKDVMVENSGMSIAMRWEMVKEAKQEAEKYKETSKESNREVW